MVARRLKLATPPEEIAQDLLAHTIPGTLVVAAMVTAVAVLQTDGRFSYITVG